ncbi:hypothetical protein FZEAL_6474 [Fusarium zealandicum]|uniref:HMG box domain-containing protein n=1 Tax=Fusarium zealandicum TaxID=1053134 RepID=A0A8H4XIT5_9HYPO|nr:hypothetical protein FZEAL_6474 [Fusarium zealandicum]
MNPSANTSHGCSNLSPDQGFMGYPYPPRYSTPVRDDDLSAYEPSSVYSHKSEPSFTGYTGGLGITSNPYGPLPDEIGYNTHVPYTPEASPSTPCPANESITTRSGLSISKKPLLGKSPAVKSGRVQKRNKANKAQNGPGIISKPLSEIAKDLPDIPVADIGTFVARSAEVRLTETSRNKKAGQIKRPMNAFMLYRKAYQDVAKTQCAQNNHQHVSKVCGAGWPLEPPHIREMFDGWAKMERMNHQNAHPGYKFTPSKPRKVKPSEDGDGNYNGFSDNEGSEWNGGHGPSGGARKSRFHASRMSETPSVSYDTVGGVMEEPAMAAYQGMYAYPTPERSHGLHYGQVEPIPYDWGMRQYHGIGVGHDMISRTPSPGFEYSVHGLGGFSSNYYPPPEPTFDHAAAAMFGEASYGVYQGLPGDAPLGHEGWLPHMVEGHEMAPVMGYEETTAQDAYLRGRQEDWKVEELDETGHFDHWMTQTEQGLL